MKKLLEESKRNTWCGSGVIDSAIKSGCTSGGIDVCSFKIVSQTKIGVPTWVRVNAFIPEVVCAAKELETGNFVYVEGELMTRKINKRDLDSIEIRAFKIERLTQCEAEQVLNLTDRFLRR